MTTNTLPRAKRNVHLCSVAGSDTQRSASFTVPRIARRSRVSLIRAALLNSLSRVDDSRDLTIVGRDAWALGHLLQAGERGCTLIEQPEPRWSHYVDKIRKAGIVIEIATENHAGAFAGHHARYVLRSRIAVLKAVCAGEGRNAA